MRKPELLEYTQDVMDLVADYMLDKSTKIQMDAGITDKMNEHLGKSWLRRKWEA